MNNDYCEEEFQHICRGGACSSRYISDRSHPNAEQMKPIVGEGLAPPETFHSNDVKSEANDTLP